MANSKPTMEERMARLESEVAEIKERLSTTKVEKKRDPEVASEDLMSRDWADMEIKKHPPMSKLASCEGRQMSQCSPAYLLEYAKYFEWKARKGREENPPRLNNKGKPWYENDELVAKIARGWHAKKTGQPLPKARPRASDSQSIELDEEIAY